MSRRSQIYVRFDAGEEKGLIANYYSWNYGERMVSRARWGIDLALHDMGKNSLKTLYQSEHEVKRLSQIFDTNFDLRDVAIHCDIIKEWEEQFPDGDFNEYVFNSQHCNDGKLLIDICQDVIKYAFLDNDANPDFVMNAEQYMRWDTADGGNWRTDAFLSEKEIATCEANIEYIEKNAKLMTEEEVKEFIYYEYCSREKAKKEVLVNAIDFENLEPVSVLFRLRIDKDMGRPEIIHAIHLACLEYCRIEGRPHGSFNYGDFDAFVPNDICEKYGIAKLEIPFEELDVPYGRDLIEKDCYSSTIHLNPEQEEKFENLMEVREYDTRNM